MPEGHVLHHLAHRLTDTFGGQTVRSSSPQGRFGEAVVFDGAKLDEAWARGKHLFVRFAGHAEQVHVHLGIYGAFTFEAATNVPVVGQVRWRLESERATVDLRGPSRCRLVTPDEVDEVLQRLGPDPLDPHVDPAPARERILRSRAPIATLLLDQSVIAGVGNVYRAEVLFRLGIDPLLPGRELSGETVDALWRDLVTLMAVGAERARIDTVRPEHEPEAMGRPPRRDDHGGEVYVYRRQGQPCLVCGSPIQTEILANRNLFWCRKCQTAD